MLVSAMAVIFEDPEHGISHILLSDDRGTVIQCDERVEFSAWQCANVYIAGMGNIAVQTI